MTSEILAKASEMLRNLQCSEAFELYGSVANDPSCRASERAEAFHMMGFLVRHYSPSLDADEETGIRWFRKALELSPMRVDTLLEIASSYGGEAYEHKDIDAFRSSMQTLAQLSMHLNHEEKKIYEHLVKQNRYILPAIES